MASASSTPASFFLCVMNRLPFTAKTKPSGVPSRHRAYELGRCSE